MAGLSYDVGKLNDASNVDIQNAVSDLLDAVDQISNIDLPEGCDIDVSGIIAGLMSCIEGLYHVKSGIAQTVSNIMAAEKGSVDYALGLGDSNGETMEALFGALRDSIKDDKAYVDAACKLTKAIISGETLFYTLNDVVRENDLDPNTFLQLCGYDSFEQLRGNEAADEALAQYMLSRGDFEENKYIKNLDGSYSYSDDKQAYNSAEVLGYTTSIWAYIHDCNMVEISNSPFYVHSSGGVYELPEMSYAMIKSMRDLDYINNDEYSAMIMANNCVYNTYTFYEGNTVPLSMVMRQSALDSFPEVKLSSEEQDEIGYNLCDYFLYNERYNYINIFENGVDAYYGFKDGQSADECIRAEAKLYYAWMCAHGYEVIPDKYSQYHYSLVDENGKKIEDFGDSIWDKGVIRFQLDKIFKEVQERHGIQYTEESALWKALGPAFDEAVIDSLGEILGIEGECKSFWEEALTPLADLLQTGSAIIFGAGNFVEAFVDGVGMIVFDVSTGIMYIEGTAVSAILGVGTWVSEGSFGTGWEAGQTATKSVMDDIQKAKREIVGFCWANFLQSEYYKTEFGKLLDQYAAFDHESDTYKWVQDNSETVAKNIAFTFLEKTLGIPKEVSNGIYKLGKSAQESYNEIQTLVADYNKANGTNLDWADCASFYIDAMAYSDGLMGAIEKATDRVIGDTSTRLQNRLYSKYDFCVNPAEIRTIQSFEVGIKAVAKGAIKEATEYIDSGISTIAAEQAALGYGYPTEVVEWAEKNGRVVGKTYDRGVTVEDMVDVIVDVGSDTAAGKMHIKDDNNEAANNSITKIVNEILNVMGINEDDIIIPIPSP